MNDFLQTLPNNIRNRVYQVQAGISIILAALVAGYTAVGEIPLWLGGVLAVSKVFDIGSNTMSSKNTPIPREPYSYSLDEDLDLPLDD